MKVKLTLFLFLIGVFQFVHADILGEMGINKTAYKAIKDGNIELVRELISQGLDPNHRLGKPGNVMGSAAFYERPAILAELIAAGGNIHHKLNERMYFTNFVASRDNFEMLKIVVAEKPDFNSLMYLDQFTMFTGLLKSMGPEGLEYILENSNADVNFKPEHGFSALYLAYEHGKCGIGCVETLLEHCADPSLEAGWDNGTFTEYVTRQGDLEVLRLIESQEC